MIFKNKSASISAIALLLCAATNPTFAADDVSITVGAKLWNNKWTSWDYYPPFGLSPTSSLPGASENFSSGNQAALLPSLTVRVRNFLVTGSVFADKKYDFTGSNGIGFDAKRSETDLHVGYYVLPTLALTVGYKNVEQDFNNGKVFKYSGPIIGVVGSAPLTQGYSLYGNFGYGAMTANLPNGFTDNSGRGKLDADYYLSEVGVAYSFDVKSLFPSAKAMTATLGYRSQTLATQGFAVGLDVNNPSKMRSTELRDNTEGLALGVSITF
ncbi:MAG: hypothetical protein KBF98_02675 [Rhodoferax sp.]|jgi:hypothetical protein|nr:hypothetical protein [Rhodoferax sp.]MBP9059202.1 hypothetical protein [Rhodoferax sp.]MBP9683050.1 hypothetical protein [Rhodoferax sp.]